jgi:hypothetical protein
MEPTYDKVYFEDAKIKLKKSKHKHLLKAKCLLSVIHTENKASVYYEKIWEENKQIQLKSSKLYTSI